MGQEVEVLYSTLKKPLNKANKSRKLAPNYNTFPELTTLTYLISNSLADEYSLVNMAVLDIYAYVHVFQLRLPRFVKMIKKLSKQDILKN